MSRRTKRQAMASNKQPSGTGSLRKLNELTKGVMSFDAFVNTLARTGYGQPNHMEGTQYPLTRLTRDYTTMTALYRGSWIAKRIIDTVPKDMMKNGWKYLCDLSPDEHNALRRAERSCQLFSSLRMGMSWGRLYGGAAGIMLIEGQEDKLTEPLDVDEIMPGDYKGLLIKDRWSGVFPHTTLVSDINSPDFGLPEFYDFEDSGIKERRMVHHSRVIRFTGDELPEREKQAEAYWSASKMEAMLEDLKRRDNASANISGLMFLANLRVLKMSDLGEMLTGVNAKAQEDFYNTIQAMNWLQSNFGMYLMSKDDDFQVHNSKYEGLDSIYELFMMDLSGASQIPATKLFGRSPAGMNATGESDLQNYYDHIDQEREDELRPKLDKILPVHFMSTLGYIPDDLDYMFNPVRTPSDKELGEQVKWKTDAIYGAHDRNLLTDRCALMELRQLSDDTGLFSNITDDMIEAASDEFAKPLPELPDDPEDPESNSIDPSPEKTE